MADGALHDITGAIPAVLWQSCDGMMVIDESRRILAMNPALETLLGQRASDVVGKSVCGVLMDCRDFQGCPLYERRGECPGLRAMERFEPVTGAEYLILACGRRRLAVSTSYTPIRLTPEHPVWALMVLRDVTAQKRRERQLIRQAKTDPLTGLPNRAAFLEMCQKELKRAARTQRPLAIGLADLDGFKSYNDTHGHLAGDELLKAASGLLRVGRRAPDLVARYGGDEFALLLPETDTAGAMVVAERLHFAIAKFPFGLLPSVTAVPVTISIGVAVYPEDGRTTTALLEKADQRLYDAKHRGANQVRGPDVPANAVQHGGDVR